MKGLDVAIANYGDAYGTDDDPKHTTELAVDAFLDLVRKTGISRDLIGGVFTGRSPTMDLRPQWNNIISSYLKITPAYTSEVTSHGAGVNATLAYASAFVSAGIIDYALILVADNPGSSASHIKKTAGYDSDPEFELPYGPTVPSIYAQGATRYMHEYGVTEADLAQVAVDHQAWAVHHPYSAKGPKGEITIDTVLRSRMIADPIRLWNSAIWGPQGTGGALLVTSAERAADLTDKPVRILGFGGMNTHEYATDRMALRSSPHDLGPLPNLTHTGARHASRRAYEMAGITASDVGMVQCGNNFTHMAMIFMEDFGFCEKGQAPALVRSGRLRPGGDLPWNTNGGWLSFGQPGISCGMDPIIEAVRQLRGEALGLQVQHPGIALTHAVGGMMACHHVTLLSR
ncbi:thiolase family protein [Dactylosporangium sp. NPDC051485]|uniref:thiolase family protein n=1 Tax=Dactylosporangium sp. NPDC051485 TaxID=3154846 RepID=UPI00341CDC21